MTFVTPTVEAGVERSDETTVRAARGPATRAQQLSHERLRRRLRLLGLGVLILQLAFVIVWNHLELQRFAEGQDFAGFYQIWYLIGHGVLNPGPGWWHGQAIFIMWPLGLIAAVFPQPLVLLSIQALAVVGAEAVAYLWILQIAESRPSLPLPVCALLGLALLVANPWVYYAISWDYHSEALGVLFALLAARDFCNHRVRRGWLWSGVTVICGMIPATYLVGLGVGLLACRGRRRTGLLLAALACGWLLLMLKLGAGGGLLPVSHSFLRKEASSPVAAGAHEALEALRQLPHVWRQVLSNLAPSGFVGAFTAPAFAVAGVAIGTGATSAAGGSLLIAPSYQNLVIYMFVPVGTMIALRWTSGRFPRRFANYLILFVAVCSVLWAVVWLPSLPGRWLNETPRQVSALEQAQRLVPRHADLVISGGVSGTFGDRAHIDTLTLPTISSVRPDGRHVWFLIAPYVGTEFTTVWTSASILQSLAQDPHARLLFERDGVWLFEWTAPAGARPHPLRQIALPHNDPVLSAALFETGGARVLGPAHSRWAMSSAGRPGRVLYGDQWLEPAGAYRASVRVRSDGPFAVAVRDTSTKATLARRVLAPSRSEESVSLPVAVGARPGQAAVGDFVEVTVTALSRASVTVRTVSLRALEAK